MSNLVRASSLPLQWNRLLAQWAGQGNLPIRLHLWSVLGLGYKLEGVQQIQRDSWGLGWRSKYPRGWWEYWATFKNRKMREDLVLFSDTQGQDIEETGAGLRLKKSSEKSVPGELRNLTGPCPEQCDTALLLVISWAGHQPRKLQSFLLTDYDVLSSTEHHPKLTTAPIHFRRSGLRPSLHNRNTKQRLASLYLNIFPIPVPCREPGRQVALHWLFCWTSTPQSASPDVSKAVANRSLQMYKDIFKSSPLWLAAAGYLLGTYSDSTKKSCVASPCTPWDIQKYD